MDVNEKRNRYIHNYTCRLQTPLSTMDRITRQKISKGMEELNNTAHQKDLIGIYGTLYPAIAFFSSININHSASGKHLLVYGPLSSPYYLDVSKAPVA